MQKDIKNKNDKDKTESKDIHVLVRMFAVFWMNHKIFVTNFFWNFYLTFYSESSGLIIVSLRSERILGND